LRAFDLRATNNCLSAMESGRMCERHVRDVLKSREVDTSGFEKFLASEERMVRLGAARIIAAHGDVRVLVDAVLKEEDRSVLLDLIVLMGDTGKGLPELGSMLSSTDELVRDEAVELLRRTGSADELLPLIFAKNDALVERVKRYMNE